MYRYTPIYVSSFSIFRYMRCGYEVTRIILLQAYPYTNSLLRGVTFKVLSLSSYVFSPVMLPLLWNSFQCYHHILWMSSIS